jgi:hypothetical protein
MRARSGAKEAAYTAGAASITSEIAERAYRAAHRLAEDPFEVTKGRPVEGQMLALHVVDLRSVVLGGRDLHGFRPRVPSPGPRVRTRALPATAEGCRIVLASFGSGNGVVGAPTFACEVTTG